MTEIEPVLELIRPPRWAHYKEVEESKLMTDINTVSLSGVLANNVETSKTKGIAVARFFIDVEGAGDKRAAGNFKVVAFAEQADMAKELAEGDRIVLVGALLERRGRGVKEMEIRARNIIPLSQKEKPDDVDEKEEEEAEEEGPEFEVEPVE